jgi:peroxidase
MIAWNMIDGARLAGDVRAQEQPGLTSMHTLWMREHNRVAKEMAADNPSLSDEELFQESRRLVAAQLQNIVYDEWLPKILGSNLIDQYGLKVDQR